MEFTGFPEAALDFYDDLEIDNTKSFWQANKHIYDEAVHAPMVALCDGLAAEFGTAKLFRPYRDVRFSSDKAPYKTHQGAYVGIAPHTGWYVQISARGLMTGGGFYHADPPQLAAFRDLVADPKSGPRLRRLVTGLEKAGWTVGGETLKTAPRGFDTDHPRIDLLRHKSLTFGREHGFDKRIHTAAFAELVAGDWRELRPLITLLTPAMAATS